MIRKNTESQVTNSSLVKSARSKDNFISRSQVRLKTEKESFRMSS